MGARAWTIGEDGFLFTVVLREDGYVFRSRAGFADLHVDDDCWLDLALPLAPPRSTISLPMGALREVIHDPDQLRRDLAGELPPDAFADALRERGWDNGIEWDGRPYRVPEYGAVVAESRVAFGDQVHVSVIRPNPFRPGRKLETDDLPGREEEISLLMARVEQRCQVALLGPRRVGKTSLLETLQLRLRPSRKVYYRTLEGGEVHSKHDFARLMAPETKEAVDPAEAFEALLRSDTEEAPVLLVDEVDYLRLADLSLFEWLRSIGQNIASIVYCGSHGDWTRARERANEKPGSRFANDVTPIAVGPISEKAAREFLASTAPEDVPLDREGAADWVVELCGGWPFYLQVMGAGIVQQVRQRHRRALSERAGVFDVYRAEVLGRYKHVLKDRWDEAPSAVRQALLKIRRKRPPAFGDLPIHQRDALETEGWRDDFGGWVIDAPFFDWVESRRDELQAE